MWLSPDLLNKPLLKHFFVFVKKMWLEQCPDQFKVVLSYLNLIKFQEYLNKYYPSKKLSFAQKKSQKTLF